MGDLFLAQLLGVLEFACVHVVRVTAALLAASVRPFLTVGIVAVENSHRWRPLEHHIPCLADKTRVLSLPHNIAR